MSSILAISQGDPAGIGPDILLKLLSGGTPRELWERNLWQPVLLAERVAQTKGAEVMPNCQGLTSRQILEVMEQSGLNMMIKGGGRVVAQFPAAGQPIDAQSTIWVQLQPPQ